MLRPLRALSVMAFFLAASPAFAMAVHRYNGLALSPAGDRIATVEAKDTGSDHAVVTLRSVADGHVLRTIDPCVTCGYGGLAYAPDGRLAFLARGHGSATVRLMVDTPAGRADQPDDLSR